MGYDGYSDKIKDLNTSHVKVKQRSFFEIRLTHIDLNTSHVKVKLGYSLVT